jgi:type IV secretion system protein VirB10
MRQSNRNIDDLVNDEQASVETGRTGFGDIQATKKVYPGMRAFVGLMALAIVASVGWFIYSQAHHLKQKGTENAAQQAKDASSLPTRNFGGDAAGSPQAQAAASPASAADTQSPNDPQAAARAAAAAALAAQQKAEADIMKRRLGQAQAADSGGGGGGDAPVASSGSGSGSATSPPTPTSADSAALQNRMGGAQVMRVSASVLKHPRFTIAGGTMIPCGTTTELDTTVPGQVSCMVTRDVYSADGTVRLIDKGAKVTGEDSGGIKMGQARVFVLWTRLRNPDNVTINLMSPGAGQLGAAGVPGQVDTHFWERFGGAMFVSVFADTFQGLMQVAANSTAPNGQINLNTTSQTGDSLARDALNATINIPPTLYTAQGSNITIYVRNDLDFSDVYGLAAQGDNTNNTQTAGDSN